MLGMDEGFMEEYQGSLKKLTLDHKGVAGVNDGIFPTGEIAVITLYDFNGSLVEEDRFRRHSLTIPALIRANSFY
jgi:hypothetical protein